MNQLTTDLQKNTVTIVGAGIMGTGIIHGFAVAGLPLNFPELRRHFTPLLRTWGVERELEESEGE